MSIEEMYDILDDISRQNPQARRSSLPTNRRRSSRMVPAAAQDGASPNSSRLVGDKETSQESDRRRSVGMMSIEEMHDILDGISRQNPPRQSALARTNRRRSSRTVPAAVESCARGDPPNSSWLVDDKETSRQTTRRVFATRWVSSATFPSTKKGSLGSRRRPTQ